MSENDPAVIVPQISVPSSFRSHIDGGQGRTFPRTSTVKFPVYEQGRFERQVYYGHMRWVGTGAAIADFGFAPGEDFPSFQINEMTVRGENTNPVLWYLIRNRQPTSPWAIEETVAKAETTTGYNFAPLVQRQGVSNDYNASNETTRYTAARPRFYRNKGQSWTRDGFSVQSVGNITNTQPVYLFFELESIPDAASFQDVSNQIST